MSAKQRTRIGLIGAGGVTEGYHLPALRALPQVEIAWVCDADRTRARSFAALFGVPAAHASLAAAAAVDAVLVGIPVSARAPVLEQVTQRGWHALCEKPFALTVAQQQEFIALARGRGVRLGVGLQRRFYSTTDIARAALDQQLLGTPRQILAGEGALLRRTGRGGDWYQASSTAGGVLFEAGSHLVDQVLTICRATGFQIEHCRQEIIGDLELETSARGTLETAAGERVPFAMVVSRLHDVYNGIVVRCAHGELRVPLAPDQPVTIAAGRGAALPIAFPPHAVTEVTAAVRAEWEDFLASCAASAEFTDADTGLLTTEFLEGCCRAAAQPPRDLEVRS